MEGNTSYNHIFFLFKTYFKQGLRFQKMNLAIAILLTFEIKFTSAPF